MVVVLGDFSYLLDCFLLEYYQKASPHNPEVLAAVFLWGGKNQSSHFQLFSIFHTTCTTMFLRLVPHWSQSCRSFWLHCLVVCENGSHSPDGSLPHLQAMLPRVFEVIVLRRGRRGVWPRYHQSLSRVIVVLPFSVKSQSLAEVVPVGGFIHQLVMSGCSLIHPLRKTGQTWTAGVRRPLSEPST